MYHEPQPPAVDTPSWPTSSSSSGPRAGTVVRHAHQAPWEHEPRVRHGVITAVHEPAVVGVDEHGQDVSVTHAQVAWFGADGVTTVPLDELEPIG